MNINFCKYSIQYTKLLCFTGRHFENYVMIKNWDLNIVKIKHLEEIMLFIGRYLRNNELGKIFQRKFAEIIHNNHFNLKKITYSEVYILKRFNKVR